MVVGEEVEEVVVGLAVQDPDTAMVQGMDQGTGLVVEKVAVVAEVEEVVAVVAMVVLAMAMVKEVVMAQEVVGVAEEEEEVVAVEEEVAVVEMAVLAMVVAPATAKDMVLVVEGMMNFLKQIYSKLIFCLF